MPLSDTTIRKIKVPDKTMMISDDNGLYLEVRSTGTKTWKLRLWENGKERKISLGRYLQISLAQARHHRDEIKAGKVLPIRLSDKKTFNEWADEWLSIKVLPERSATHIETIRSRLNLYLRPLLGNRFIEETSAPELLYVLRRIEKKGFYETAHRYLGIYGQISRFAIASGVIAHDLSSDLKDALHPVVNKGHFASLRDPQDIGHLLIKLDTIPSLYVRNAAKFQAYTMVRPGELRRAEWTEIDYKENLWRISADKMKMRLPHVVPLSRQAMEILEEIAKNKLSEKWIFPMVHRRTEPMSECTVLMALKRLDFRGKMTGHGFRSMASTYLNEHGWNSDAIERQLAHKEKNASRRAYNFAEYLTIRREMLQWWADELGCLKSIAAEQNNLKN